MLSLQTIGIPGLEDSGRVAHPVSGTEGCLGGIIHDAQEEVGADGDSRGLTDPSGNVLGLVVASCAQAFP